MCSILAAVGYTLADWKIILLMKCLSAHSVKSSSLFKVLVCKTFRLVSMLETWNVLDEISEILFKFKWWWWSRIEELSDSDCRLGSRVPLCVKVGTDPKPASSCFGDFRPLLSSGVLANRLICLIRCQIFYGDLYSIATCSIPCSIHGPLNTILSIEKVLQTDCLNVIPVDHVCVEYSKFRILSTL